MTRPGHVWGWRRPGWRFWTAVVVLLGVSGVTGWARVTGGGPDAGEVAVATASVREGSTTPTPTSSSTWGNDGVVGAPATPYGKPPPPAAARLATAFTRAWVHHPPGTTSDAWWRAVSRYTDRTLTEQLRAVDPSQIPATRVTGSPQGVFATPTSAEVAVPTDAGRVVLLCVLVSGRWVVATVDLERKPS